LLTTWNLYATLEELSLLRSIQRGEFPSFSEATASDERVRTAALLALVFWGVAIVVWLIWQYSAHRRLRRAGVADLRFTPGWGVGWWFVPIANLFKPYQAVKELWMASDPAPMVGADGPSRPAILPWWWGTLLVSGWVNNRSAFTTFDETVDGAITSDLLSIVGDLCWIVTGILAIAIVVGIDRRQASLVHREPRALGPTPARPDLG
jgi:Domain of unknown function (DUF4328)